MDEYLAHMDNSALFIHYCYSEEDGGYIATVPAYPGLSAFGTTTDEARDEFVAVLELALRHPALVNVNADG